MRQQFCFSYKMGLVGLFIMDEILNYYNSSRQCTAMRNHF